MLCEHFEEIANNTWINLKDAKRLGIFYGEETITNNILLYLARLNLPSIKIIQTPKNIEAKQGTDWEWWIGSKNIGWLRYAVQAKKLYKPYYDQLNHKVGKEKKCQNIILKEYAEANKAIPLYALYNYIELDNYKQFWNCKNSEPVVTQFGCTVTPLKNVTKAIGEKGGRTFEKIHEFPETIPLKCLVCCPTILAIYQDKEAKKASMGKFGVEAKIYQSEEVSFLEKRTNDSMESFHSELYDKKIYPKRVLVINLEEKNIII